MWVPPHFPSQCFKGTDRAGRRRVGGRVHFDTLVCYAVSFKIPVYEEVASEVRRHF